MRKIKYYSKKIIKYSFGILILIMLILIPLLTMVQKSDDETGLDVIDNLDILPSLVPSIEYENGQTYPEHGYGEDVILKYDEAKFNGYSPVDYLIVVTKSPVASGYLVEESDPLYWAPTYSTMEEVEASVSYSKLKENNVTVDFPPDSTDEEIELLQQEKIKEHILNNVNHFANDGTPLFTMYESNFTWTLESVARFEKTTQSGTLITQEIESEPISINITKDKNLIKENREDGEVILTPDVNFNGALQQIETETNSLGETNDVIKRFVFDGNPTGEIGIYSGNGYSTFSLFGNSFAPRFKISCDELMYLDIFEKIPTIDLELYLSDNDDSTSLTNDIKIIEQSQEMSLWELQNKVIVFDPTYIGSFEGVYDETNTLAKPYIKFKATLSYQYKTEEEILALHPNAVLPNYPVETSVTHELGSDDKMMCVQKDDLKIFQDQAQFDRKTPPSIVVYENWDLNGKFNVIFATKDKYIFESDEYDASKLTTSFAPSMIDDNTGQVIEMDISFTDIKTTEIDGETVYYSQKYPANSLFEDRTYYFSSKTRFSEKNTYTPSSEASAVAYVQGYDSLTVEDVRRYYNYESFTFVEYDEISIHDNFEGLTIVTSDNFHEAASHVEPDYFMITMFILIASLVLIGIPLIIYLSIILKRKLTERN